MNFRNPINTESNLPIADYHLNTEEENINEYNYIIRSNVFFPFNSAFLRILFIQEKSTKKIKGYYVINSFELHAKVKTNTSDKKIQTINVIPNFNDETHIIKSIAIA